MRRVALLAALLLAACGGGPHYAPLGPGTPVLAFGDSVTHGSGAAPGEDFPSRLAALSGWQIANAGLPGDTAAAVERIAAALAETRPRLVLIELGGNDFLQRRPESAVKEDLRRIVAAAAAAGATPVLIAVPRFSPVGAALGLLADAPLYAELATEAKIPLVKGVFAEVLGDSGLHADAIHPNAAGYRRMAEGIAAALAAEGLLARR